MFELERHCFGGEMQNAVSNKNKSVIYIHLFLSLYIKDVDKRWDRERDIEF